jgi:hypothetical protein
VLEGVFGVEERDLDDGDVEGVRVRVECCQPIVSTDHKQWDDLGG